MALKRAIPAATSPTFLANPQVPTFFPSTNHLAFARRRFNLKCSMEYSRDQYNGNGSSIQVPIAYSRPAEVQWKKELCNTVHLIGVVGLPVEIKHLPSGKVLAWTRLAVKKSATDTSWINLTFWDELAHVAFQHVEKGQQIYVTGRLISDSVETDEGKQQTYYKVVVQQLNFVEKGFSSPALKDHDSDSFTAGRNLGNNATKNITETTQELWQAFFANPVEWWDNRKTKRNPKYPDFKHKDTGEALWIEGRNNPPWVKSQLAILDTRMGTLTDQDHNMHTNIFAGDSFSPF
ncbi:protein OSB2, chloroplastic-like isoform X1 [Pyrus x bretschneideri]|uniref:protein OSB2, chloroplastic-like isoform X1 n=1 Tax=Pyrus x bretschneideri TaxID=225117 RepID=UPI00202EC67E|nr:protein OSB2, chloroplastic-like isoform X1 [Pyrus x bretschneideri]